MHLTNYSLNKYSKDFDHGEEGDNIGETGSKRKLAHVLPLLEEQGFEEETFWSRVEELAVKSIVAIEPELRIWERARQEIDTKGGAESFQILGFDVLIDSSHKLWLLEINHNPSLSIDGEAEVAPGVLQHSVSQVDVDVKKYAVIGAMKHAMGKLAEGTTNDHAETSSKVVEIGEYYRDEICFGEHDAYCGLMNTLEDFFSTYCATKKEPNICSGTRFNRQLRRLPICKDIMSAEVDLIFLKAKRRIVEDEDWGGNGLPFFEFIESLLLTRTFKLELPCSSFSKDYCEGSAAGHKPPTSIDVESNSDDDDHDSCGASASESNKALLAHLETLCVQIEQVFGLG